MKKREFKRLTGSFGLAGKEDVEEEVSKAGESWSRNVIIEEEQARGGERTEKGWCMTPEAAI